MTTYCVTTCPELFVTQDELDFRTAQELEDWILFEHAEMERARRLMETRPRRWHPRRIHESRMLLSLYAPDEGRVNQDAEG